MKYVRIATVKKLFFSVILSICLVLTFAFTACNDNLDDTHPPVTDGDSDNDDDGTATPSSGNILVAYFSWSSSGNTERMATYIAERTHAFVYEIEPLVPYPTEYTPTTEVALEEKNNNARPEIKNPIDVSEYDYIFVGFPIWWHTAPMIIGTFLESYQSGRKRRISLLSGRVQ